MNVLKAEYSVLQSVGGGGINYIEGIPKLYSFGSENNVNYMVIELLGKSLENLQILCGGKFSIITTFLVGKQLVK